MSIACLAALLAAPVARADPPWYAKQATWPRTIAVSLANKAKGIQVAPAAAGPVTTPVIRGGQRPRKMTIAVKGWDDLILIVTDAGDGINCDNAIWGNAKLYDAAGKVTYLDKLRPAMANVGHGRFVVKAREMRNPAIVGAARFSKFMKAHAPSVVHYKIAGRFSRFEAMVGVEGALGQERGSVKFLVTNDVARVPKNVGSGPVNPLWAALERDFPAQRQELAVARDWFRQDGLKIDHADEKFQAPAGKALTLARATLTYVEKFRPRPVHAAALKPLAAAYAAAKSGQWRDLYLRIRQLRRDTILSHPKLDFRKILINRNPPTTYSHNGDQHLGQHSRSGPGLTVLTDWKTNRIAAKAILADKLPRGATRNPDLHYDADRVAFAFCDYTRAGKKRYFLYEAAIDGSWVRQLTGTARDKFQTWDDRATVMIEDNDPCYLPDDHLVFISTRGQSFGRCHGGRYNPAWVLHRCDPNGDGVKQLSYGNENEYEPSMLNDGRIVFTRWEYTNRHEMFFHMLWQCRPDGTNVAHFFGNDMLHPMMMVEASSIPGTHKVVCTAQGHHSYNTGTTIVLDTNIDENGEHAITHITPETPYSESQGWPNPHYSHPYAITEELYLASRANHKVHPQNTRPPPANRGIYLVDSCGGRELIYDDPSVASFSPIPIRKRVRPPVLPSLIPAKAPDYGTVFLQNAYLTRNDPEGIIKPGMIKAVRVIALGVQPRARREACSLTVGVEIPKKVLGTVPVDADGAAHFRVPARTSLQIQTLDENGMAILTEKSLFYLQPGERRSCVGCHEPVGTSPLATASAKIARMAPVDLTPSAGPQYPGGLSFMRTVQPVLDRYCIGCHGLGKSPDAKARHVNLIHDGVDWPQSFKALLKMGDHRLGAKRYMGGDRNISRPRRFYAYRSKLSHMLVANHGKTNMDRDSYMRIIEWLDVNAQCYGDLFPNKIEQRRIDAKAMTALRAYAVSLFGNAFVNQPDRALINVAQPDESRILMAPLAASAGGWGQMRGYAGKTDPRYKKMAALLDKCIIRRPDENRFGWQPTLEAGGGERWVMEERKRYMEAVRAKAPEK